MAPMAPATRPPIHVPPDAPSAQPSGNKPRTKLHWRLAARRLRELIGDEFRKRERAQDVWCPGVAQEGKPCAFQMQSAKVCGPAHHSRRCHRPKACNDADQ